MSCGRFRCDNSAEYNIFFSKLQRYSALMCGECVMEGIKLKMLYKVEKID